FLDQRVLCAPPSSRPTAGLLRPGLRAPLLSGRDDVRARRADLSAGTVRRLQQPGAGGIRRGSVWDGWRFVRTRGGPHGVPRPATGEEWAGSGLLLRETVGGPERVRARSDRSAAAQGAPR